MDLSCQETPERLASRIRAHKLFANIELGDWIEDFLDRRTSNAVLDLGCGAGTHIGLFLRHVGNSGMVTGLDRDAGLIARAGQHHPEAENLSLRIGSMDDELPFPDGTFDICFSNFAIYHARDAGFTLREVRRVLAGDGEFVLTGPAPGNASELYSFNEKATGRQADQKTPRRAERIVKEIIPLALETYGNVEATVINSVLAFPNRDEFIRYFCATPLYEEIAERGRLSPEQLKTYCTQDGEMQVSKEMVAVVARK
jgi:SAM-dependent methyltransferase